MSLVQKIRETLATKGKRRYRVYFEKRQNIAQRKEVIVTVDEDNDNDEAVDEAAWAALQQDTSPPKTEVDEEWDWEQVDTESLD